MARETVRNGLVRCGLDAFVDDALVVTSELVTRALASGGDAIFLELHVADDSVEVAVRTPAPAVPTQRHPDEGDAPAVALVRTLTSGNGVEPQADGGRRAWARFARPPA
jgi:hypothetical protein